MWYEIHFNNSCWESSTVYSKRYGNKQDKFCPQVAYNEKEDEEVYFQGE